MAINWLGGLQGGLGGAGSGAALGSMFAPGIGTAVGGGLGALIGSLGGLFGGGQEGGIRQAENRSPQQLDALSLLLSLGSQGLQNPYAGFEPIKKQYETEFEQQVLPGLAERFASLGSNRIASSPAFATQATGARANLSQGLAGLQSQYGMENQRNALSLLSLGLSPAFENYYQRSQPGFGENLLTGAIQAAPSLYQSYQLGQALEALKALQDKKGV